MVKRNGNEGMPVPSPCVLVEGLGEPVDKVGVVVGFVAILVANDSVKNLALGAVAGAGPAKIPVVPGAGSADKAAGEAFPRGKGIAALPAVGRANGLRFRSVGFRPGKGEIQGTFSPITGLAECG